MKKTLAIFCFMTLFTAVLAGCHHAEENEQASGQNDDEFGKNECYAQCEEWGGGSENVAMCKKNCDASNDKDSVWNQSDDKYNSNDSTAGSWPSDMPSEVPEFKYGSAQENVSGMGSWIVDFDEVDEDALEKYEADLEDAGWSASVMSVTNTLNGKFEGKYTISVSHDKEYKQVQIMVRKAQQ